MRPLVFDREKFPFLICWVCFIDLYALFTGAGGGKFVGAMLKNNLIPGPTFQLYPLDSNGMSIIYPDEKDTLPTVLQLNYDVFILAARLGLLASEYRRETVPRAYGNDSINRQRFSNSHPVDRMEMLFDIQHALRHVWESPGALLLAQEPDKLPRRPRELYQHVSDTLHNWFFLPEF
jgi:hypothetical protein